MWYSSLEAALVLQKAYFDDTSTTTKAQKTTSWTEQTLAWLHQLHTRAGMGTEEVEHAALSTPTSWHLQALSSLTVCPAQCQLNTNSFSRVSFPFYAFFLPVHIPAYL